MAESSEPTVPSSGKVRSVADQWRVFEDGALAGQLQNQEFKQKYGWNRKERKTARKDVPLAKVCQSEEEERLQREHMERLEQLNAIARRDAELAQRHQEEEEQRSYSFMQAVQQDEEIARQTQRQLSAADDSQLNEDGVIAAQFQTAEMIEAERHKVMTELQDQALALKLQEKEHHKYLRWKQERALHKERKALRQQQRELGGELLTGGYQMEGQQHPPTGQMRNMNLNEAANERMLRTDGRVEDLGDFSDFFIVPSDDMTPEEVRELQELQDEELARLLQDQEKKRGAHVDREKMKAIEAKDAQIAKLIYEQQKLRLMKKRRQKNEEALQQMRNRMSAADDPEHLYENTQNEALARHSAREAQMSARQHSPSRRDLPPYRPPPAHFHGSRPGPDSPPYQRAPGPPLSPESRQLVEYADRPLPTRPTERAASEKTSGSKKRRNLFGK